MTEAWIRIRLVEANTVGDLKDLVSMFQQELFDICLSVYCLLHAVCCLPSAT
jgi:hypothetical protein